MSQEDPSRPVTTTQKSFEIIEELKAEDEHTLIQLSKRLPYSKSTIHRHLETLVSTGYVLKDGNSYRLSLRFLNLGIQARRARDLFLVSKSHVDKLAEKTGERVWYIVEEDGHAVHVYGNVGQNSVKSNISIGDYSPLHSLAAGKAILAYYPEENVDKIITKHGLPKQTENTKTTRDELFTELEEVRERQVAFNREESSRHLFAVGAPIRDEDGVSLGAISVSGPARRLKGKKFEEEIPESLLEVTNEIEIDLLYD
ncbi:IclR family transcriptional regulator [Haloarchaeobius salinus]|uniref:IclR family transcriptional regulator n=1 Tax=Haloarchaeobius salinus TaxID=1198298 RepID=UPI00210C8A04|nr:IclR family transcriptional regulator [Haloarchaeobius salinus]